MRQLPLPQKVINDAAKAHAVEVLGKEQYEKNKDARMSIMGDFKAAVNWTMTAMLQIKDSPGDPAHRLVTTERLSHQLRGYDADHDAQYKGEQLAIAGILLVAEGTPVEPLLKDVKWPIPGYPDKRGKLDRVRQRVIGTALIAGQIDIDIKQVTPVESEATNA